MQLTPRSALAALALLAAAPAAAEEAPRDVNGHRFCFNSEVTLRETGAGAYEILVYVKIPGDLSKATFPGGTPVIGPNESFKPGLTTGYKVLIGLDGKPTERPRPMKLGVTVGRYSIARPEPIWDQSIRVQSAGVESVVMQLSEVPYSVAVAMGDVVIESFKDSDTDEVVSESRLTELIQAAENGASTITLYDDGKEIAIIPVPKPDLRPQITAAFGWTAKTAQALTARGSCG